MPTHPFCRLILPLLLKPAHPGDDQACWSLRRPVYPALLGLHAAARVQGRWPHAAAPGSPGAVGWVCLEVPSLPAGCCCAAVCHLRRLCLLAVSARAACLPMQTDWQRPERVQALVLQVWARWPVLQARADPRLLVGRPGCVRCAARSSDRGGRLPRPRQ